MRSCLFLDSHNALSNDSMLGIAVPAAADNIISNGTIFGLAVERSFHTNGFDYELPTAR